MKKVWYLVSDLLYPLPSWVRYIIISIVMILFLGLLSKIAFVLFFNELEVVNKVRVRLWGRACVILILLVMYAIYIYRHPFNIRKKHF